MSRIGKSIETESRLVFAWGWGWMGGGRVTVNGPGFLLGRLKWSKIRWLHSPVNILKSMELCT